MPRRSSRTPVSNKSPNRNTHEMNTTKLLTPILLALGGIAANAQMSPSMSMPAASKSSSAAEATMTDGVVQKVDKSRGVVTLKHGEIANMSMPPMTMGFDVADKKMLEGVKVGDKVKFRVEKVNNAPIIVRLEPSR